MNAPKAPGTQEKRYFLLFPDGDRSPACTKKDVDLMLSIAGMDSRVPTFKACADLRNGLRLVVGTHTKPSRQ